MDNSKFKFNNSIISANNVNKVCVLNFRILEERI